LDASVEGHGHAVDAGHTSHVSHIDDDQKVRIGMFMYVLADVLFGLFVFISYLFLRVNDTLNAWFAPGTPDLGGVQGLNIVLTVVLIVSGIFYAIGQFGVRAGNGLILRVGIVIAAVLWLASIVGQYYYMAHLPFVTADGAFASAYIFMSGYHMFHLLVGLPLMIGVTVRSLQGRYTRERHLGITVIGYYWYWAVIYNIIFFVLPIVASPHR
jgi:cytochrome c oxidase subunit 3